MLLGAMKAGAQEGVQGNTLVLSEVNDQSLAEYYFYYFSEGNNVLKSAQADSLFNAGFFKKWIRPHNPFNPGVSGKDIWFRLVVKNNLSAPTAFFWTLYNHVDSAILFQRRDSFFEKISTVMGNTVAKDRPVNSRNFALPFLLQPKEATVLYLRVVNRAEPIYLPMDITSREDYLTYEERFWIFSNWYWLIGFFLFAGIFNLVLFFFLHDKLHLWYVAYLVFSAVFLLMEDSIDSLIFPSWLYKLFWAIGQLNFLVLSAAASIGILQSFLKQQAGLITKIGKGLILSNLCFVVVFALARRWVETSESIYFIHNFRMVLLAASFAYQLIVIGYNIKIKSRSAYYYAAAFVFYFVGAIMFFLNDIGISVRHGFSPNALAIGLFWELLLLLFFITLRFQFITRDNTKLRIKELEQQKSLAAQIILAQDEERQRLAKDLHDDLGNTIHRLRLVMTKLKTITNDENEVIGEMEGLLNKAHTDVRNISHELMPVDFQENGLEASLRKMCNFLSENSKTAFQFFFTGHENSIPKELQLVVYRIFTEFSSNIIKHANATQAVMQCSIYDDHILITAEDNGSGFSPMSAPVGIGLRNIRNRVELLKGKITTDSNVAGTTIIIEIPLFDGSKTS